MNHKIADVCEACYQRERVATGDEIEKYSIAPMRSACEVCGDEPTMHVIAMPIRKGEELARWFGKPALQPEEEAKI